MNRTISRPPRADEADAIYHAHYHTVGEEHIYQGRYKSFPIQDGDHFLTACRYVERNARTAKMVVRAENWRRGSLWNWCGGNSAIKLSSWPVARLPSWVERVNAPMTAKEEKQFKQSLERGGPFGNDEWVEMTVKRLGLESTQRSRGRPRKFAYENLPKLPIWLLTLFPDLAN